MSNQSTVDIVILLLFSISLVSSLYVLIYRWISKNRTYAFKLIACIACTDALYASTVII